MKKLIVAILSILLTSTSLFSQKVTQEDKRQKAHYNINKFRQLNQELPTPNKQHTASGAPGSEYTHQQVDYKMNVILDDENQKLFGEETITYHNNSKDALDYLWLQLDQNINAPDSKTDDIKSGGPYSLYKPESFTSTFIKPFEG